MAHWLRSKWGTTPSSGTKAAQCMLRNETKRGLQMRRDGRTKFSSNLRVSVYVRRGNQPAIEVVCGRASLKGAQKQFSAPVGYQRTVAACCGKGDERGINKKTNDDGQIRQESTTSDGSSAQFISRVRTGLQLMRISQQSLNKQRYSHAKNSADPTWFRDSEDATETKSRQTQPSALSQARVRWA
jgi:hypothetical protein